RAGARLARRPLAGERRGAGPERVGRQRPVRAALPAECRPGALDAPSATGAPRPPVAATAARPRPVAGGPPSPRLPHRRRDVPRVPARPPRRAAVAATPDRHSRGSRRGAGAADRDAVAVRGGVAVRLHGGVHVPVRRRREGARPRPRVGPATAATTGVAG